MKVLAKHVYFLALLALAGFCLPQTAEAQSHSPNKVLVPLGGNAWITKDAQINSQGLVGWSNPETLCTCYLRATQAGSLNVSLLINTQNTSSKIKVTIEGKSIELQANSNGEREFYLGEWNIAEAGYVPVQLQGISKTGATFGIVSHIAVSGSAITNESSYVQNNVDNYFLWGRRGPSVHLNFDVRKKGDIEWFYSEITVPQNNDVIGSYYMANGFGQGYFGMQVNSANERKVLFSVWSPYATDDPKAIPEEHKIKLLRKGSNVVTGEFGNEGSGGQSFLRYHWKAGNTYKFLLQGYPAENNTTVYTAYFFAPEENQWLLIASFQRPNTSTYLTGLYSFLENFNPEYGNVTRMAYYGNQWVMDREGNWSELTETLFTGDNTARKNYRKDYAGGTNQNVFYLKNCGFFSEFTPLDQRFTRNASNNPPDIDFSTLPY